MSSERLEQLLQECLSAYEAGLSPEECLSAFPEHRDVLEPMFRQALSLRVLFAAAPSEEFRSRSRERFLFAAGRDVTAAMASAPDPTFVSTTRQRLRNTAGAGAQEALRNVPPPRLPFWINTRRRLLEAAAAPRPAISPVAVFMRAGMSAAVVVLAMTLAGLAYITTQSQPPSVGAQLADIEQQLAVLEGQRLAGQDVEPSVLIELSRRTNDLVQRLNESAVTTSVSNKLPEIIERQQAVVESATVAGAAPPELQEAKQQLQEADEGVKLLAARADQATATATSQPASATTPAGSGTPPASGTPSPTATPVIGQPLTIRISTTDTAIGLIWVEISTDDIRFVVPDSWQIEGVATGVGGVATMTGNYLSFKIENATILVDMRDGEVNALIGSNSFILRAAGPDARPLTLEQLIAATGTLAPQIHYFLGSFKLEGAATPTPTSSPTASPTSTTTPTTTATSTTTATTTSTTSTTTSTTSTAPATQ